MEAARAKQPSMLETPAGPGRSRVGFLAMLAACAALARPGLGQTPPDGTLHEAAANTALALDPTAGEESPAAAPAPDYAETFRPASSASSDAPLQFPPSAAVAAIAETAPEGHSSRAARFSEAEFVGPPRAPAATILPPLAPLEPVRSITIPRSSGAGARSPASARKGGTPASGANVAAGRQVAWYRSPWVALALVIALIYAGARVLRKHLPAAGATSTQAVRVLGRTPLGPKQAALLLQVGPRVVLVGQSGERLTTLCEFGDPAEVAMLLGRTVSPPAPTHEEFANHLAGQFETYDDAGPAEAVDEAAPADDLATADETLQRASGQLSNLVNRLRALQADAR